MHNEVVPARPSVRRGYGPVPWFPLRNSGVNMTREDAETLFDLMELYKQEHPEATDDEAFEAVCMWNIDRYAARIDALKEQRRDSSIYAS